MNRDMVNEEDMVRDFNWGAHYNLQLLWKMRIKRRL